jgi:hypothetical protein
MRFKAACDLISLRNDAIRTGRTEGHAEEKLEIAAK